MKLAITHRTHYRYAEPLRYAIQSLWLWPRSGPTQTVRAWTVQVPGQLYTQSDGHGNALGFYTNMGRNREACIEASGLVDTLDIHCWQEDARSPHPWVYLRDTPLAETHPRLRTFAQQHMPSVWNETDLLNLAGAVCNQVRYRKNTTQVDTSALEAFDWGAGVCQDQAHVMIALCRSLGIPARYVSGYFYAADEPDLASHAWVDICLNPAQRQWISLDVTHACWSDERHVRLATGTDYTACPPIRGIRHGGGQEQMDVQVLIRHLDGASD